ncbi:MAG TPA: Calx-beta domain-containing protein, partial [Clostridia bacterium]|nr:Calx-beta domain-containing protein [Clostridia bacterium]
MSKRHAGRWYAVLGMVAALAGGQVARAVPYASGITSNAGTISFVLNESADDVKVIFDGGGTGNTNELGALVKGTHSFALGSHTSYEIHVTKSSAPTWAQISDDLNPLVRFYGPRGLAVFNNPTDLSRFGRIYVSDAGGLTTAAPAASNRTTQKGIYMLKADQSDALGYGATAQNGGLIFGANGNSPFKIELGEDNYLYIGDFFVDTGTIYRTDADVSATSGVAVLEGAGQANPLVHTTANGSPIAKGSLEAGTLKLWCIDGRWGGTLGNNALLRWDITDTLLPHNMAPTELAKASVSSVADVQSDLDIAPDGKFFVGQNRAIGTANVYNSSQVNLRVYDTDGVTVLFDSLQASIDIGNGTDVLANLRALKVSPDGKKLAVIRNDTQTMIVALTNGIPDLTQRTLVNTFGATSSSSGREVTWDAAGNLYASNISHEKLRVWSPGGSFTAITRSSGQFELTSPPTVLTLAAAAGTASEAGPLDAVFTVTRSGDVSGALTVNYALSGTAVSGTDYAALPGSVTFLAGAASTNIIVDVTDDAEAEAVETIILTLGAGAGYSIGSGAVTVALLDNELPQLTIAAVQPNLLEGFAGSKATFRLTRRGDTNVAVAAGIS